MSNISESIKKDFEDAGWTPTAFEAGLTIYDSYEKLMTEERLDQMLIWVLEGRELPQSVREELILHGYDPDTGEFLDE